MNSWIKLQYDPNFLFSELEDLISSQEFRVAHSIPSICPFSVRKHYALQVFIQRCENDIKNFYALPISIINNFDVLMEKEGERIRASLDEVCPIKIGNTINAYLSPYGCQGYFIHPDCLVVNAQRSMTNNDRDIFMTIFHEIIHLLLPFPCGDYEEMERKVDQIFTDSYLGKLFPEYLAQDFSDVSTKPSV